MDSVKTGDNNNIAKLTDKANSNSENQDYLFFFLFFFSPMCLHAHNCIDSFLVWQQAITEVWHPP